MMLMVVDMPQNWSSPLFFVRNFYLSFFVHVSFNLILDLSENGDMCAMKEVTLFSDDAKSKESAQQLGQVSLLCGKFGWICVAQRQEILFFEKFQLDFHTDQWHLTGNCTAKPLTASKYSTVLWIWVGKLFVAFGFISYMIYLTSLLWSISRTCHYENWLVVLIVPVSKPLRLFGSCSILSHFSEPRLFTCFGSNLWIIIKFINFFF